MIGWGVALFAAYGLIVTLIFWHRHAADENWHRAIDSCIDHRKLMLETSNFSKEAWETQKIDDEIIEDEVKEKPFYSQMTPEEQRAVDAAKADLSTKDWWRRLDRRFGN
jgi:hypothetical protein